MSGILRRDLVFNFQIRESSISFEGTIRLGQERFRSGTVTREVQE